jgi:mxaJ protein
VIRRPLLALAACLALGSAAAVFLTCGRAPEAAPLRVCADPNNLPFSNARQEGFENRIAELLAQHLGARLEYAWHAQRRGFVRNTLRAGECDVLIGVPTEDGAVRTSRPYYRSSYVFVTPRSRQPHLRSLDDPRLRTLRIGVQMIGDDFANTPPAHALSARGLIRNIVGYSVIGDYAQPDPPARIVEAVARGEVDTAVVWGPLAGYFAPRQSVALDLTPVTPVDRALPFAFDISMAVRESERQRLRVLDAFLVRYRAAIDRILTEYGVPRA